MPSSLSKSIRFDVFKRDKFTCQYCGRKPPEVILHVDHILAKANGGGNTEDNLITSCQDCNLGKGARPMDRILAPISFSIEERLERMDQVRAYQDVIRQEEELLADETDVVAERWAAREGQPKDAETWMLDESFERSVRQFLKLLGLDQVLEAVDVAFARRTFNWQRFRYFCGVCWKKHRDNQEKKGRPCT